MVSTEQLLCELIALKSVNPGLNPEQPAGEKKVAEYLAAVGANAGLDIELQQAAPGRPIVLARLTPPNRIRQRILLAPHLDTVDGTEGQFRPVRRSGRIYGRGACDTKGSVAAMFTALCDLAEAARRPESTEIVFAGLIDEENAQLGSRFVAKSRLKYDLAIVGEPTRNRVVTAHKGSLWVRVETTGKSAHGSRPELGRNAVHAMARVIEALESDYAAALRRRRHALLGNATINVGVIRGGTQPNIVPDQCSISADRRTLPGETLARVQAEISRFLAAKGFKVKIGDDKAAPCHPMETDASLPLVRQFLAAAGQANPVGVDYFCDAAVLSEGGIPSVVFGPGDIAQAHTADEWIAIRSLETGLAKLRRFLQSLP